MTTTLTRPVDASISSRPLQVVLGATALIVLFNSVERPFMLYATIPLVVATAIASLRTRPIVWLAAAVAWAPGLIWHWDRMEDHVYFGAYWLLAVGLALATPDFWSTARRHARLLIGAAFAAAVAWKLLAPSYISGETFEFVFVHDERFHGPFAQLMGGLSGDELTANEQAWRSLRLPGTAQTPIELLRGPRTGVLLTAMVTATLLIEAAVAVAFLAPDRWRISRIRHVSLLVFAWSIYLFVPVLGFAWLLMLMGAVVAGPRSRWCYVYAVSAAVFTVAGFLA